MVPWDSEIAIGQPAAKGKKDERARARVGGEYGWGQLTYCYSYQQRFEEGIILSQKRQYVWILGDIDEDREGIFGYRLYALGQRRLVFQRFPRMSVAHRVVLNQQLQILHGCELGGLENHWLGFGVWEEILRR